MYFWKTYFWKTYFRNIDIFSKYSYILERYIFERCVLEGYTLEKGILALQTGLFGALWGSPCGLCPSPFRAAVARALLRSPALQHESTTLHFNQLWMNPLLIALNCFSPMLSVGFGRRDENNSKSHQRSCSALSVCRVGGGTRASLCHPARSEREKKQKKTQTRNQTDAENLAPCP